MDGMESSIHMWDILYSLCCYNNFNIVGQTNFDDTTLQKYCLIDDVLIWKFSVSLITMLDFWTFVVFYLFLFFVVCWDEMILVLYDIFIFCFVLMVLLIFWNTLLNIFLKYRTIKFLKSLLHPCMVASKKTQYD